MEQQTGEENVIQKRPFNFGTCLGLRNLRLVYIRDDVYLKFEQAAERKRISIETLLSIAVSIPMDGYFDEIAKLKG